MHYHFISNLTAKTSAFQKRSNSRETENYKKKKKENLSISYAQPEF